jgi:hypothetical protein
VSHNQSAACYLNVKKAFFLSLEILIFASKKPTGDRYFVEKDLSL